MQYVECRGGEIVRISEVIAPKLGVLAPFVEKKDGTTREHPIPLDITKEQLNIILDHLRDGIDPYLDLTLYSCGNYLSLPITERLKQIRAEIKRAGDEIAKFNMVSLSDYTLRESHTKRVNSRKFQLQYSDDTPEFRQFIVQHRLDTTPFEARMGDDYSSVTPINVIVSQMKNCDYEVTFRREPK